MARFTERVRFAVPSTVKAEWKAAATTRGMSLSAFLRDLTDDLLAEYSLEVTCAEIEFRQTGATLQ
jgi:hypothetical protein